MSMPKAIISLTSWRARINTCGLTIYTLLRQCPGFHIVLCLSSNEFPGKEFDLPHDIQLLNKLALIEILWVSQNYKSFKKWIFASLKYPNLPIISADDDCIYKFNFAERMYNAWLQHKDSVVTNEPNVVHDIELPCGCETLYPPLSNLRNAMQTLINRPEIIEAGNDDFCIGFILKMLRIPIIYIHCGYPKFHDDINGGNYVNDDKMLALINKVFCNDIYNFTSSD